MAFLEEKIKCEDLSLLKSRHIMAFYNEEST